MQSIDIRCPKMKPSQNFESSLNALRTLYTIIGQNIFADQFRRNAHFYVFVGMMATVLLFNGINLLCTNDASDTVRIAQAAIFLAIAQTLVKYYWLVDLRPLAGILIYMQQHIHSKNSQPGDKYYELCGRYGRLTWMMPRIIYASFAALLLFIFAYTLVEACTMRQPLLYVYFPFVREYSGVQLVLLNIALSVIVVTCPVYVPACDLLFAIVVANLTMYPSLIAMQMDDLSAALQHCRRDQRASIKRHWMHYIVVHQKYNSLVKLLDGCLYKYCVFQFLTSMTYSILAILANSKETSIVLYCVAATGLAQLGVYCVLGTVVEHSADQIYDAVYSMQWYKLPVAEQRVYHQLLLHAQQRQIFYIANVIPLNVAIFLSTLRLIYTYATVFAATI